MHVYNLDLETMLSTLQHYQLSGKLVAEASGGRTRRESGHIEITINCGKAIEYHFTSETTSLTGENARQAIAQAGILCWSLHLASPTPSGELSPVLPQRYKLKRRVTLSTSELNKLPRSHFQVYAHIDGRRSVEDIAQLLRITPQQVEDVLRDLQSWQLVSIELA